MSLHSRLIRHVLRPLVAWRRGEAAQLRYEQEFDRSQWFSADQLRDLQMHRLSALLRHAHARCPFYRERFLTLGISPEDVRSLDDLRHVPITEKRDIQQRGPDMVAHAWPSSDLIDNQTGGSTGQPLQFKLSLDRKCSRAAATTRHNEWAGYRPGDLAAVLWGAPQDRPQPTLFSRFRDWLMREPLWLDTGHITEAALWEFHHALLRHRPRILLAYARSAVLFARWLEENGLRPHRPRAVITTAEVLEDEGRETIERVFNCRAFNRYGCREVSIIASECPVHSGLHVMAEGLIVEIETPRGPARPGEVGTVLLTDLLNHAMPLIRYRVGDMAAWAQGDCPCGRNLPRLERLAGRVTDFLVGTGGQLVSGAALTINLVAKRPSLGQVQVRQTRPGEAVFRVVPGPGFDSVLDTAFLQQAARRYLGDAAEVSLEVVDHVPLSPSGKYLFSQSTVPLELLGGRIQGSLDLARQGP